MWDVALVPSPISRSELSVLVRLPVRVHERRKAGQSVVEVAGTSGCGAKIRNNERSSMGVCR
jgi:hypothetical protein